MLLPDADGREEKYKTVGQVGGEKRGGTSKRKCEKKKIFRLKRGGDNRSIVDLTPLPCSVSLNHCTNVPSYI